MEVSAEVALPAYRDTGTCSLPNPPKTGGRLVAQRPRHRTSRSPSATSTTPVLAFVPAQRVQLPRDGLMAPDTASATWAGPLIAFRYGLGCWGGNRSTYRLVRTTQTTSCYKDDFSQTPCLPKISRSHLLPQQISSPPDWLGYGEVSEAVLFSILRDERFLDRVVADAGDIRAETPA
jgi:hypothetical protein